MALSLEETNKRIHNPERGVSVRSQNKLALKKAGKAVKESGVAKKAGSLVKGAARFAAPLIGAADAAQRMAQNPTSAENLLTSGVKTQAKFIDEPISAVSNLITGQDFTPVRTSLDAISAGAEGLGAGTQSFFGADKTLEESAADATRIQESSLRRRQGETAQEPSLLDSAVDLTGIGTPVPTAETTETPEVREGTGANLPVTDEQFTGGTTLRAGQTDEGFVRRVEDSKGGFGTITTAGEKTTDSPEAVGDLAQNVADQSVRRAIMQADLKAANAPGAQTASRIKDLEEQLAQPQLGPRQSFGAMLEEGRNLRAMQKQLKELYAQQRTETTQRGQDRRAGLVSQDKARDRSLKFRELAGKQDTASQKERRTLFNEAKTDFRAQAKLRSDNPKEQAFFEAKLLETHFPDNAWSTSAGRIVRQDAVKELNTAANNERGFFDWAAQFLGGSKPRTEEDYQKLDFEGWSVNDKG